MKSKLIKVALMVVIALTFITSTPPARADDDKPPCKPAEHDCRCDPGQSRDCDPPCKSDDDDCKPAKVWVCYIGDVVIDRGSFFLNTPWVRKQINKSELPAYIRRHLPAFRVLASRKVICPYVAEIPFAKLNHDGPMAGGNP